MSDPSVARFWDKYISKTKAYGVKKHETYWYVRNAERYIKSLGGVRLAKHSPAMVEKYLTEKGRNPRLTGWQFTQLVKSLKILFKDMVSLNWAHTFPWDDWIEQARELPNNHSSQGRGKVDLDLHGIKQQLLDKGALDGTLFARVFDVFPEYITNLVIEIRLLQYSIRTEQAYLGWVLRFLSFNIDCKVSDLDEEAIKQYLNHLVIENQVSSSTQAQALNALIFFYKRVLNKELSNAVEFIRSRKPKRLPVVLTK